MLRTSRIVFVVLIVLSISLPGRSAPADELSDMLTRAESLYYEADFAKSIELLLRVDELLREPGQLQQKAHVKLQLALAFMGLNDRTRAKAYLDELYALDSDHYIDPQMFSPKVIQLADEAKAEQNQLRCRSLLEKAQEQLRIGNADAVVKVIRSGEAKCSGLAALYPKLGDVFFKEGQEAYKKSQMTEALQKFREAVRADPKHELAAQYLDLARSKLEIASDFAFLTWRKDFDAGELSLAAHDYREVLSRSSAEKIEDVRTEYRRVLSGLVDSWNRACAANDVATMEEIRLRVNALLPEPSFAEDVLAKIRTCTPTGCIQMSAGSALARLRNRVDPQFPSLMVSQIKISPMTFRVKARINESGDIATSKVEGGNPILHKMVQDAFNQWKFSPAIWEGEARCVDTEIPIVVHFAPK